VALITIYIDGGYKYSDSKFSGLIQCTTSHLLHTTCRSLPGLPPKPVLPVMAFTDSTPSYNPCLWQCPLPTTSVHGVITHKTMTRIPIVVKTSKLSMRACAGGQCLLQPQFQDVPCQGYQLMWVRTFNKSLHRSPLLTEFVNSSWLSVCEFPNIIHS